MKALISHHEIVQAVNAWGEREAEGNEFHCGAQILVQFCSSQMTLTPSPSEMPSEVHPGLQ